MHESKIDLTLKEKEKAICSICESLEEMVRSKLSMGAKGVDTHEMGEVVDMVKDMYEAKEKLYKACYYKYLMEVMEKEQEEDKEGGRDKKRRWEEMEDRMYYPVMSRMGGGNSGGNRGEGGMWEPDQDYERGMGSRSRRGSGNSGSDDNSSSRSGSRSGRGGRGGNSGGRYGFSFDEYVEARDMYQENDPDQKRMRMEILNRNLDELVDMAKVVVRDMSPDEKQVWKTKISKILNA